MATRRAAAQAAAVTGPQSSAAASSNPQRLNLLKQLVATFQQSSPSTGLFYAEQLNALDPQQEPSVYIYATLLLQNNNHLEAIHLLRQPIWFTPVQSNTSAGDHSNPFASTTHRYSATTRLSRPAIECSTRCARLYAQCCLQSGREKEGRLVLSKILAGNLPLCAQPSLDLPAHSTSSLFASNSTSSTTTAELELELARLAHAAQEHDRAIQSYRRVLDLNPWCWEAVEGLCAEGAPPDPDVLYPPRPRPPPPQPQQQPQQQLPTAALSPLPNRIQHPPPLGPTQPSAVNSSWSFSNSNTHGATLGKRDGMGFFTPSDTASPVLGAGAGARGKEKAAAGGGGGIFGAGANAGGSIWRRGVGRPDVTEMSIDDSSSSSFDTSFFPPTLSYGTSLPPSQPTTTTSTSLFTPPAPSTMPSAPVPGVKRTRGGTAAASAANAVTVTPDDPPAAVAGGRRVVRGVPGEGAKSRREPSGSVTGVAPPTRRSSRLSRDTGSSNGLGGGSVSSSSTAMGLSRSQQTNASTSSAGGPAPRAIAGGKKRGKASAAGPTVLSDAGSPSGVSHSSSPAPSSPGAGITLGVGASAPLGFSSLAAAQPDPQMLEAEDYIVQLLRCFAHGACYAARYENTKAIEAYGRLPAEQAKSTRALIGVAASQMEKLEYEKAEKAFSAARAASPHTLLGMSRYSTLLWHLRQSSQLSFLAQDLMLIAPLHPTAWLASGNVFSVLEDHSAALKCFKRASQLDENCVEAYTLSGHECVVLEEWERALGFFREAVRREGRCYQAWFGLGNVYLQTGKLRLAEYHFRKAAEINSTNATLICCVGTVLEKLGRRKDALELYERACALAPDSPAVRFKRVRMLIALRQYEVAESDLLLLKDRAPNEFNVHYLLGKLYKYLGSGREADMLKHFGLAQDLEPRMASLIREQIEREINGHGMEVDEEDGMEAEE